MTGARKECAPPSRVARIALVTALLTPPSGRKRDTMWDQNHPWRSESQRDMETQMTHRGVTLFACGLRLAIRGASVSLQIVQEQRARQ